MKRINTFLIIFFIFSFSTLAPAKTIVISDIDDTIKLAYTLGGVKGYFQFFKKIPFIELRDAFNEIKKFESVETNEEVSFFYISAAPNFTFNGDKWIKEHNFPEGPVVLKTIKNGGPTYKYKYENIKAIILDQQKRFGDLKIIFFGDNSQVDDKVYADLTRDMNLNSEIFVRDVAVNAKEISPDLKIVVIPGVNYFLSEVELRDFSYFHFLSETLWQKIIRKYNTKKLIPGYVVDTLVKRFKAVCRNKLVDTSEFSHELASCTSEAKISANNFFADYYSRY